MNYLIDITEEELGVIASALMEKPYKSVANLFSKLNQQITEQQTATQSPVEEPQSEPQEESPTEKAPAE